MQKVNQKREFPIPDIIAFDGVLAIKVSMSHKSARGEIESH
jgi:hypothetical protein